MLNCRKRIVMKNKIVIVWKIFFLSSLCMTNISFSQLATSFGLSNVADSAKHIIVGQIIKEEILAKSDADSVLRMEDYDGTIYSVRVLHVLKGDSGIADFKLFISKEMESSSGEFDPIIIYEGKGYLLFLCRTAIPPLLTAKYRLGDTSYYVPVYFGNGSIDINQSRGLETLRRTEEYLKVSSFAWKTKTISDWIEMLKDRFRSGLQDKSIGDADFVNTLVALLTEAITDIQTGDSLNCAKIIQRIDNMINGAFSGFDRMRFVSLDSALSFFSDISYIRGILPNVPDGSFPMVDSLSPAQVYSGSNGFKLKIIGEDFANGAVAYWDWLPRTTTFISSTEIRANILASDVAKPDTATVSVVNPNGATHGADFIVLPLPAPHLVVKLINSTGARLTTGSLQYYEGSWKNATNNNDGTFTINSTAKTLSLRMTYGYGTQTKSNVTVGTDTAIFQTVNAQIKLEDSRGNPIDTGIVQYYAGAWRILGTTTNGVAAKELLPNNYTFRMTYASGSNDKVQDIGANPTVVFQTVSAAVQLRNSLGSLIDTGTVQYYAGAWRSFGTTSSGVTTKELLPANYTFRMTYESVSNDKAQDISTNSTVAFSTVLCTISVKDSQGQPVNNVMASYYSGAWRQIGSTVNGQVTKELLPANLTFRITYGANHQDKTQNLATNSLVEFTIP
jgi:hypothetical protein